MATCDFCDATVEEGAPKCPSCGAQLLRTCPSCGKAITFHLEKCPHCQALQPLAPEPPQAEITPPPEPGPSASSTFLRVFAVLQLAGVLVALISGALGVAIVLLVDAVLFFVVARIKDTTDGTRLAVNRIEENLKSRSRRR